ncbi:MAG: hypothetical protein MT490_16975 [Sphingomonas sp.]|uniref:hypothetical protein n=1 Tax=Sphingomonas sp. TaxID=28214 RepID=UPI0022736B49|nr:hypothetical protein [Sphingomonas sp.]MCX8477485.1 hypothetical protein [Sphingomonas sp.]
MNQPLPALRVERAKLVNPRPGDRERLTRALGQVTPASTGVPANALLLVRRLRVDRPLAAGIEGFGGELVDRIRAARVSARRGALGAGDSVYFEDSHALEAAIVGAWLVGERLPDVVRRSIADSETPLLRWRRRWLADVRNLPALVATLVATGTAAPWLARFEEGELAAATEHLIRAHGGDAGWGRAVEARDPARSPAAGDPAEAPPSVTSRPTAIVEAMAIARASTPQVAVRRLIAVALLAVRRPALVATRAFSEAFVELATAHAPRARRTTDSPPPTSPSLDGEGVATVPPAGRASTDEPLREAPGHARSARNPAAGSFAAAFTQAARPPLMNTRSSPEGAPETVVRPTIASDYAGLFFLLNIFLSLGLYGDFTDPARRLRGLSPFELLLMLGRHWCGAGFAMDPIEPALRSLAGLGPGERVGRDFEAPVWETPPDWLTAWEPGPTRAVRGRFGTSLWHRFGFPVADRWHTARAPAWLRRRWVACLARYVAVRLARAFGMEDPRQAVAALMKLPGEVRIDPEHVEVSFGLDSHPLAIRLAGLDRDPGWIPAAGRSVEFRFT